MEGASSQTSHQHQSRLPNSQGVNNSSSHHQQQRHFPSNYSTGQNLTSEGVAILPNSNVYRGSSHQQSEPHQYQYQQQQYMKNKYPHNQGYYKSNIGHNNMSGGVQDFKTSNYHSKNYNSFRNGHNQRQMTSYPGYYNLSNQNHKNYNPGDNNEIRPNYPQRPLNNLSQNKYQSNYGNTQSSAMPASPMLMSPVYYLVNVPSSQQAVINQHPGIQNTLTKQTILMGSKPEANLSTEEKEVNDILSSVFLSKLAPSPVDSPILEKEQEYSQKSDLSEMDQNIAIEMTRQGLNELINEKILKKLPTSISDQAISDNDSKKPESKSDSVEPSIKILENKIKDIETNSTPNTIEAEKNLTTSVKKEKNAPQYSKNSKQSFTVNDKFNSTHINQKPSHSKVVLSTPIAENTSSQSGLKPLAANTNKPMFNFRNPNYSAAKSKSSIKPFQTNSPKKSFKTADVEVPVDSLFESNITETNIETISNLNISSQITPDKLVDGDTSNTSSSLLMKNKSPYNYPVVDAHSNSNTQPTSVLDHSESLKPLPSEKPAKKFIVYNTQVFYTSAIIFPVEECFEKLPIIFKKFGSKSITFAKINSMDLDKDIIDGYNIKQERSEHDQVVRDLRSNLNKITDSNHLTVSKEILKIIRNSPTDEITCSLADVFYRKSIIDEAFLHLYAKMIKSIEDAGCSTFIFELKEFISCFVEKDPFDTPKIKSLKTQLESASGSKVDELIEDLNCANTLQKKRFTNNLKLVAHLFSNKFYNFDFVKRIASDLINWNSEDILYPLIIALEICIQDFLIIGNEKAKEVMEELRAISKKSSNRLKFAIEHLLEKKHDKSSFKIGAIPNNIKLGPSHDRRQMPNSSAPTRNFINVKSEKNPDDELTNQQLENMFFKMKDEIKHQSSPFYLIKPYKLKASQLELLSTEWLEFAAGEKNEDYCQTVGEAFGELIHSKATNLDYLLKKYPSYLDEEGDWVCENKKIGNHFSYLLAHVFSTIFKKSNSLKVISSDSMKLIDSLFKGSEQERPLIMDDFIRALKEYKGNNMFEKFLSLNSLSLFLGKLYK